MIRAGMRLAVLAWMAVGISAFGGDRNVTPLHQVNNYSMVTNEMGSGSVCGWGQTRGFIGGE